jgi:hypothetical protein
MPRWGAEVWLKALTSALYESVGGRGKAPAALIPSRRPITHCTGGCVGPRAGMYGCEKFRPFGIGFPDRAGRSESLYRLRSPSRQGS